jgi:hypothetical protein
MGGVKDKNNRLNSLDKLFTPVVED